MRGGERHRDSVFAAVPITHDYLRALSTRQAERLSLFVKCIVYMYVFLNILSNQSGCRCLLQSLKQQPLSFVLHGERETGGVPLP